MWIEVKTSSLTIRSEIRIEVFEVVAVPGHERDEHVAAQRQLAQLGRGTVGDDVAGLRPGHPPHQRTLVDAGVLVGPLELQQAVDVDAGLVGSVSSVARTTMRVASIWSTTPERRAAIAAPESRGNGRFHAGADQRRVRLDQRHGLTLHVRAHQRAVGVVVFQERDQRGGDRHELLRRTSIRSTVRAARASKFAVLRQETRSSTNVPSSSARHWPGR